MDYMQGSGHAPADKNPKFVRNTADHQNAIKIECESGKIVTHLVSLDYMHRGKPIPPPSIVDVLASQEMNKHLKDLGLQETKRAATMPRIEASIKHDAERYRWLRDKADPDNQQPYVAQERQNSWGKWFSVPLHGKEIDATIDLEMERSLKMERDFKPKQ